MTRGIVNEADADSPRYSFVTVAVNKAEGARAFCEIGLRITGESLG